MAGYQTRQSAPATGTTQAGAGQQGYAQAQPQGSSPVIQGYVPLNEFAPGYQVAAPGVGYPMPAVPQVFQAKAQTWNVPLTQMGPGVPSAPQPALQYVFEKPPGWVMDWYAQQGRAAASSIDQAQIDPGFGLGYQAAAGADDLLAAPVDSGQFVPSDPLPSALAALVRQQAAIATLAATYQRGAEFGYEMVQDIVDFQARNDISDDRKREVLNRKAQIATALEMANLEVKNLLEREDRESRIYSMLLRELEAKKLSAERGIERADKRIEKAKALQKEMKPLLDSMKKDIARGLEGTGEIADQMRSIAVRQGVQTGGLIAVGAGLATLGATLATATGVAPALVVAAEVTEGGAWAAHAGELVHGAAEVIELWEDGKDFEEMMASKGSKLTRQIDSKIKKLESRVKKAGQDKKNEQDDLAIVNDQIRDLVEREKARSAGMSKAHRELLSLIASLKEEMANLQNEGA